MKQLSPACFNAFTNHTIKSVSLIFFALFICFGAAAQVKPATGKGLNKKSITEKPVLAYKIIPAEQNTFGYDILENNRPLVHQPSIPGLPGNKGFNKRLDAEKCALLVISKINRNLMPPTVTRKELDSLKIKF